MRVPVVKPTALRLFRPSGRAPAVLLGAFIVWQLIFLLLANLLEFVPHRTHRFDEFTSYRELPPGTVKPAPMVQALAAVTDCWSQLTGQYQIWWLFAPDCPRNATFPVVELRWDDPARSLAPVLLFSSLEPADRAAYFHPMDSTDRLLHYEAYLGLGPAYWNDPTESADLKSWHELLSNIVRRQWKSMRAYLRWRTADFLAHHPELPPPDEVRLLIRMYPTSAAGAPSTNPAPPRVLPLARWRCSENELSSFLPVEGYDPFNQRFIALPKPSDSQSGAEVVRHD
jgi:hypothetical protein